MIETQAFSDQHNDIFVPIKPQCGNFLTRKVIETEKTENDFIEKVNVRPEGISVAQTF